LGDRDWHALLDAHDAVVRAQLNRFRGREVNTSGDGFLAILDGTQRATRCAMAIRDAVRALGARVSARAGPNDVLVSGTLRDLVIGSGLEFEDRGAHQLKGACRANGIPSPSRNPCAAYLGGIRRIVSTALRLTVA
jgi:class 3 adenylate cyclase